MSVKVKTLVAGPDAALRSVWMSFGKPGVAAAEALRPLVAKTHLLLPGFNADCQGLNAHNSQTFDTISSIDPKVRSEADPEPRRHVP